MTPAPRLFFPWEIHRLNLGAGGEIYGLILSAAELNRVRSAVVVCQFIPDAEDRLQETPTLLPLPAQESGLDWEAKVNAGMLLTVSLGVFVERVGLLPSALRPRLAAAFQLLFPFL